MKTLKKGSNLAVKSGAGTSNLFDVGYTKKK